MKWELCKAPWVLHRLLICCFSDSPPSCYSPLGLCCLFQPLLASSLDPGSSLSAPSCFSFLPLLLSALSVSPSPLQTSKCCRRPTLPTFPPCPLPLPQGCPLAIPVGRGGFADITGGPLSTAPHLTQISSLSSLNQFTFIASAAQKQFFKSKKVSTSNTNQFSESSCSRLPQEPGPVWQSQPFPPAPPPPRQPPHHFYCFMMPVISGVFEMPHSVLTT